MFTFPQPSDRNENEESDVPIVNISDSPEALDVILRFIYPGVEPPKIYNISTLAALFSAADKYNIASIYPVLRESLKAFLRDDPFRVYIIACRFGLSEEAREAARVSNPWSMINRDYDEVVQQISGPDLYRFVRFVQEREHQGLSEIKDSLAWHHLVTKSKCDHWSDGQDFYFRLAREVGDLFVSRPCLELKDLFEVFDEIPDPPLGCEPPPNPANWYCGDPDDEAFSCPLAPMSIRGNLSDVVERLQGTNFKLLNKAFGSVVRS